MTKKPRYKVVVGKAPHTSMDLKFDCGSIYVAVSDTLKDERILMRVYGAGAPRWGPTLVRVADFVAEGHPAGVALTEPSDRPLAAEAAEVRRRMAEAEARLAEASPEVSGSRMSTLYACVDTLYNGQGQELPEGLYLPPVKPFGDDADPQPTGVADG